MFLFGNLQVGDSASAHKEVAKWRQTSNATMDRGLVLKLLCAKVFENPESCTDVMREIEQLIGQVPEFLLPAVIPLVLSVSVPIFKNLSSNVNW